MSQQASVVAQLREAGYSAIRVEPRLKGMSAGVRPDILAYAADEDDVLVPWAAVEIKTGIFRRRPELALNQLAAARDQLGTVDNYVVVDGEWFRADSALRRVEPVGGPARPPYGAHGTVTDLSLATALMTERLWDAADARRRAGTGFDPFELFIDLMPRPLDAGLETRGGESVRVDREILWQAARQALRTFALADRKSGPHLSHPTIARAVVELAGERLWGTVQDPFCGAGEFLWEALDHAERLGHPVSLFGVDNDRELVAIAAALGGIAPMQLVGLDAAPSILPMDVPGPAHIILGDAFTTPLVEADVVLTATPLGQRLDQPHGLLNGSKTRDGELAAIDLAIRSLRPGGRAVLQIGPGPTFRPAAERYREFLADNFRIAAIIGCPGGSIPGSGVGAVILVIDQMPPTETFVAQLGDDWEAQLSPNGAVLRAAQAHIDPEATWISR